MQKLNIPKFLLRPYGKSASVTRIKKRRSKYKAIPPKDLGKSWNERLKRSELTKLHFTNEYPQISGCHLMWSFVGRKWVYLCSAHGSLRFRIKREVFDKIKIATIKEAA